MENWRDSTRCNQFEVTGAKAAVGQAVCLPRRTVAISDVGGSDAALTASGLVSDAATATGNRDNSRKHCQS